MDISDIKNYIKQTGYRTLIEIKNYFSDEDQEVLESCLSYLVSKNNLKMIKYSTIESAGRIYFIPF